jgi:hypothetical protein
VADVQRFENPTGREARCTSGVRPDAGDTPVMLDATMTNAPPGRQPRLMGTRLAAALACD